MRCRGAVSGVGVGVRVGVGVGLGWVLVRTNSSAPAGNRRSASISILLAALGTSGECSLDAALGARASLPHSETPSSETLSVSNV